MIRSLVRPLGHWVSLRPRIQAIMHACQNSAPSLHRNTTLFPMICLGALMNGSLCLETREYPKRLDSTVDGN